MADSIKMDVSGLSDLAAALRALGADLSGQYLRGSVMAGANGMKKRVVENAEKMRQTGTLARAVYVSRVRSRTNAHNAEYILGVRKGKQYQAKTLKSGKVRENRDAYYWHMVEFGTIKMSARPFLRPAFELEKVNSLEAIKVYLSRRMEVARKRAEAQLRRKQRR